MKRSISNIVWRIFVGACILWSIYYVISMTDYCGIDTSYGTEYTAESLREILPEKSAATLLDFGNAFAFLNRFGNPVVLHVEPYDKWYSGPYLRISSDIRIQCYDKRFMSQSWWRFMQITPGMTVGEVISKVGLPEEVVFGEPYYDYDIYQKRQEIAAYYSTATGKQYKLSLFQERVPDSWFYVKNFFLVLKHQKEDLEWSTVKEQTQLDSVYKRTPVSDEKHRWETVEPIAMEPYIILSVGVITAGIIVFRLKKKGLLFKKKQVTE